MNEQLEKLMYTLNKIPEDKLEGFLDLISSLIRLEFNASVSRDENQDPLLEMVSYSKLVKRVVGNYSRLILVETVHGFLAVDPEDSVVGYQLRTNGTYGRNELRLMETFINKDSNVLIVGAHIGSLTIPISRMAGSTTAIEANPETFEILEFNLILNDIKNCNAINIAANDKHEQIDFFLNKVNSGGSKRKPILQNNMYSYDNPEVIKVNAAPLDDVVEDKHYDVVLMDLEGSEYFAFKGMKNILAKSKILIVEFIPHHLKNVSNISVEEFLQPLLDFDTLFIPSLNTSIGTEDFGKTLDKMYKEDLSDEGLIFQKCSCSAIA